MIFLLAGWILFSQLDGVSPSTYCKEEISTGAYGPCAIVVGQETDPEFGTITEIWEWGTGTDNPIRWAGPPFCIEGWLPSSDEAIKMDVGACRWRSVPASPPTPPDGLGIFYD